VFENDPMQPSFEFEGQLYQIRRASSSTGQLDFVAVQRVLIAISHGDARALAALRNVGVPPEDAAFALHSGLIAVTRRSAAPPRPSQPSDWRTRVRARSRGVAAPR
jgi:hypothetical protein